VDREELLANLRNYQINDATFAYIEEYFPVAKICPTCVGRLKYNLDFVTYDCDCLVQKTLQRHYFAANIGREYQDIGLDEFEGPDSERIIPAIMDYVLRFEDNLAFGLGLTFSGPLGTGKTFAMTCALKELIKQGRDAYFVSFEDLVNIWANSWKDLDKMRLEKRLKTATILGLDELRTDVRNTNGFLAQGLESIIRHRTSNLLPTLVTTNMLPSEELDQFGKAYSLLAGKNTRIVMNGHDRRMKEVRERNFLLRDRGERRPIC
jgi:DNA replication protein DnaC